MLPFSSARMIVMPGRGEKEMRMLQREGVPVQKFDAVRPTPDMIQAAVAPGKKFTKGAVGCNLSHRALWTELLAQPGGSTMLILEDDVELPLHHDRKKPLVDQIAEFMRGVPDDWDLVFLGRCWDLCTACKRINKNTVQTKNALCTHAYALTQKAARLLLASNTPQTQAVDHHIVRLLRTEQIKAYARTPQQLLMQNPQVSSTLRMITYRLPQCMDPIILMLLAVLLCIILIVVLVRARHAQKIVHVPV
jgi:GR25 family glycosyltransferase involved in LPS biosynthesis